MGTTDEYINAAMRRAQYESLEDGAWFASIPGCVGLWASGASMEEARQQLRDTLDGWLIVHVMNGGNQPPEIDGVHFSSHPQRAE